MNIKAFARRYITDLNDVLERFDLERFEAVVTLILDAYYGDRYIFTMGNGGSGSTASHFACDINKGCCMDLDKKFKMICLNDNIPTLLALSNDVAYDVVFEEQLKNFFTPGDLVIGISGSGNSQNVLQAMGYARRNGGTTIGFSGFSGGQLARMVDVSLVADVDDMQKIEDMHMIAVHMTMQSVYHTLHSATQAESN